MNIFDIIKAGVGFLVGGGFFALITLGLRKKKMAGELRQQETDVSAGEFKSLDDTVQIFSSRLTNMSQQLNDLIQKNILSAQQIGEATEELEIVKNLNKKLLKELEKEKALNQKIKADLQALLEKTRLFEGYIKMLEQSCKTVDLAKLKKLRDELDL